jgi:hypothetical protein
MQYKSAFMKLKLRVGHRNILVFDLIARWLWKHFRLSKEHLQWYNSAKRHWMKPLPGTPWGCTGSLDMLGCVNEITDKLTRDSSTQKTVGPELSLQVSRQSNNKIKCWVDNQQFSTWYGPCSTQRKAQKLILGPSLATKVWLLPFIAQSRVLLTRHNTLIRHLQVIGLSSNPTCRKCGTEEETSVHVLGECEALAPLRHAYLGSFLLDPEDVTNLSVGAFWKFGSGTRLL